MALMWNTESADVSFAAGYLEQKIKATASSWEVVFEARGVRVLVADRSACFGAHLLCDNAGIVIGEVFARLKHLDKDVAAYEARFNRLETWQALQTKGRSLIREFWGNFVAVVVDHDLSDGCAAGGQRARYVVKDPCGTLPCYFAEHHGVQLLFSSLEDCRRMGLSPPVNWQFVRSRAVHGFLDTEIQSLTGVSTVHRGECVRFNIAGECVSRSLYWHPLHFERASEPITDSAAAARALRATVGSCVQSMASHHSSVLAQTSGGLDSSIVLGCLGSVSSNLKITCYTGFAADSTSDERRWARYAAQRGGYRHVECRQDPREVVYRAMQRLAPTVEPASYYSQWQRGSLERDLAAEYGATGSFTGDPGDSIFCATTYIYAADHCFRRHGIGMRTLRTALRVATRREKTIWEVLAKVVQRKLLGPGNADELRRRLSFNRLVAPAVKVQVESLGGEENIWTREGRITEETRQRLGTLAFPPEFYDLSTSSRNQSPCAISPLCAQPVMEICLRIPVDIHFDEGRSRGLARRAFADVVPAPILRRQWKDRPFAYFDEVIHRNLQFMREHLLDGALVRRGILDRVAVELALKDGPTRSKALSAEIVSHLDLELWIRDST
jgi:asparagine synthase (glutamine-hydrolysing)